MITRYLSSLTTTFSPLNATRAHRIPRLLLAQLPSAATSPPPAGLGLQIKTTVLPSGSAAPASVVFAFKDGRVVEWVDAAGQASRTKHKGTGGGAGAEGQGQGQGQGLKEGQFDLGSVGINDVVAEVDRHSRLLRRKEELSG